MRLTDLRRLCLVALVAVVTLGAAESGALLATAAKNRDAERVRTLLTQQVDVNVPDADGTTALHWMARWNDADIVALLINRGAHVDAANRYGATPLWVAAGLGNAAAAKKLLDAGADPNKAALSGEPPVVSAALSGSAETVRALLAKGAAANAVESWRGQTALMMAVGKFVPSPDVTKVLIEYKADVNIRSTGGMTALLFAVRQRDIESVRLLLNAGANVDDEAKGQMSALRIAIDNGHYELAHLLLNKGADVKAPDINGFTPLHAAVLKRAGGNPERGDKRSEDDGELTMSLLRALIARGADVNVTLPSVKLPPNFNPDGYPQTNNVQYAGATPFWVASVLADLEVMRFLVDVGANPRAASMEKTTPLMVAAGLGYGTRGPTSRLGGRRLDTQEAVVAVVKQLIEWGNDVSAANDKGQTALHGAVASAAPPVAQLLLDHGAPLNQKDEIGRTPFIMADEHRTDKYRTNQSLDPKGIMATYELLRAK